MRGPALLVIIALAPGCGGTVVEPAGAGGGPTTGSTGAGGGATASSACSFSGCPEGACGASTDGCGNPVDCGDCPPNAVCIGGVCAPVCTPVPCPGPCGLHDDGCGGMVDCGGCPPGQTCQGNTCVCAPKTCMEQNAFCGPIEDGCGGLQDCGACVPPEVCGGGGVPHVCAPNACFGDQPKTCAQLAADCGVAFDGAGSFIFCGDCAPGETCGGGGQANQCGAGACASKTCWEIQSDCGTNLDGCGGTVDCGACAPGSNCVACGPSGTSTCSPQCGPGSCCPSTCLHMGLQCGLASDGCGGLLDCGTCPAGQVCGGGGVPWLCG